jgi:hypothetical protein
MKMANTMGEGRQRVQNVGCSVKECKYHATNDVCSAEHISVQNENAQRRAETFCGPFANKGTM